MTPKEARLKLGFSQSQMATACNTSIGTVTKWDQEKREPRGQAERLIEVLLWLQSQNLLDKYLKFFS